MSTPGWILGLAFYAAMLLALRQLPRRWRGEMPARAPRAAATVLFLVPSPRSDGGEAAVVVFAAVMVVLITSFVLGASLYLTGRPEALVPPQLRRRRRPR